MMTRTQPLVTEQTTTDTLNQLVGILPDTPLAQLRSQRADIARFIQGSYDALLTPSQTSGVTWVERGLIALRVATLTSCSPLVRHYRNHLRQLGESVTTIAAVESVPLAVLLSPRLTALIKHTDLLTLHPAAATFEQVAELRAQGLRAPDIVTLAQLIAFLSFQVRALATLQLLQEEI
ncbi:MAG: CMD domain protein [Caldilineaceae bacterium]